MVEGAPAVGGVELAEGREAVRDGAEGRGEVVGGHAVVQDEEGADEDGGVGDVPRVAARADDDGLPLLVCVLVEEVLAKGVDRGQADWLENFVIVQ